MGIDQVDLARLTAAVTANAGFALVAWRSGAANRGGAVVGALLGGVLWLALDWRGYVPLVVFVVLGSLFTGLGRQQKAQLGTADAELGQRTWRQAAANTGVGVVCAVGAAATGAAVWRAAFVGSLAAALADTTESELGVLVGRRTWLVPSLRPAAPGTDGAVSLAGTALGLLASALVGTIAAAVSLIHWRQVGPIAVAGCVATLLESLAASGRWRDNDQLNVLTTLSGAVLAGWWAGRG